MKQFTLTISFLLCVVFLQAQSIDTENSLVKFSISNMKWRTVEGTFGGMKGDIKFNPTDLANSSFNVCIDPATVNTGIEKRDDHLKNEDFFNVEKYPEICFKSIEITKTSNGYVTKGELTMHGVTKQVEINFTFNNNTFTGNLTLNRFDYNVGENMKKFVAGEEAQLEIICKLN